MGLAENKFFEHILVFIQTGAGEQNKLSAEEVFVTDGLTLDVADFDFLLISIGLLKKLVVYFRQLIELAELLLNLMFLLVKVLKVVDRKFLHVVFHFTDGKNLIIP